VFGCRQTFYRSIGVDYVDGWIGRGGGLCAGQQAWFVEGDLACQVQGVKKTRWVYSAGLL
jgi:hypothetical protein